MTAPRIILWTKALVLCLAIAAPSVGAHATAAVPPVEPFAGVRLVVVGAELPYPVQTFVVTHGLGGTKANDRFHRLAALLKRIYPQANVFLVDWADHANATILGLPNPWAVAPWIDPTGAAAAQLLLERQISGENVTLIGESFGVYVNQRIAIGLGRVARIIACNPANESGGYAPPDLRTYAEQSISLVSASPFDTRMHLAQFELLLSTDAGVNAFEQHQQGIAWLCMQLESDAATLFDVNDSLLLASTEFLSGRAAVDGSVDSIPVERQLPGDESPAPAIPSLTITASGQGGQDAKSLTPGADDKMTFGNSTSASSGAQAVIAIGPFHDMLGMTVRSNGPDGFKNVAG